MGYDPLPWEAKRKKIIQFTKMMMMIIIILIIIIIIIIITIIIIIIIIISIYPRNHSRT